MHIRLGTRASQLALWQSNWVRTQLALLGCNVELIEIRTAGDDQTQPLSQIGGQGLFTKRLQIALLENEIDLAVHSLKDLPTDDHPQLCIAAIPLREIRNDALIASGVTELQQLSKGAKVGTGSVRRAAQLLALRPDLNIVDIRGNVDTRLKKLDAGDYDAIVLAGAGLTRLGWVERISFLFPTEQLLPAVGQGALGLETRADDWATRQWVGQLNHGASYFSALAERAMLRKLYAGCLSPVGADTTIERDQLTLTGVVLSRDGAVKVVANRSGELSAGVELGVEVAEALLAAGAGELLKRV